MLEDADSISGDDRSLLDFFTSESCSIILAIENLRVFCFLVVGCGVGIVVPSSESETHEILLLATSIMGLLEIEG